MYLNSLERKVMKMQIEEEKIMKAAMDFFKQEDEFGEIKYKGGKIYFGYYTGDPDGNTPYYRYEVINNNGNYTFNKVQ